MIRPVKITARKNNGVFEFDMNEGNGPDTEILVFNKTKDGIPKSEYYDVEFTLQNTNTNLAFVTDRARVMNLSKGSDKHLPKCPRTQSPGGDGQFSVTNVTATTLNVENKDDHDCFYRFAINFEDRDNSNAPVQFDPIWGNQNGGGGGFSFDLAASPDSIVSGTAAGLLVTLLNPAATIMTYVLGAVIGAVVGMVANLLFKTRRAS